MAMALRRPLLFDLLLRFGVLMASLDSGGAQVGVCYGQQGSRLPSPEEVVDLYKQEGIRRMRIYEPDQPTLEALGGTNIELILGVPNRDLQYLASSQANATKWVENNVLSHPSVKFRYIALGNEVAPLGPFSGFLLPAMKNVHNAIGRAQLGSSIRVSTPVDVEILVGHSFPPSEGAFREEFLPFLDPIIEFLVTYNAPLLANVYPYFSYIGNSPNIRLTYALFTDSRSFVQDGSFGYQNLFDAFVDALYSALEKAGGGSLEVVVSETGWPSDGEIDASINNARIYNTNLVEHVKGGTPKRPGKAIEAYIFAMFDEDKKTPEFEKHWGLFLPNKRPKYSLTVGNEDDNFFPYELVCG